MQLPLLKSPKKAKSKKFVEQNPFEMISGGFMDAFKDDLVRGGVNEAKKEILLKEPAGNNHHSGELSAGHELDLAQISHEASHETHTLTEMGHEFQREIIHAGKVANHETSQETAVKIQEIIIEIKQLAVSSEQLQKQVEVISLEQTAEKPGVYHLNFLEQMLSFIRDARMNVEDSLAWFSALRNKKSARQYHSMAKKHGTSFTLSGERTPATSSVG